VTPTALVTIAVFAIVYLLIASEKVNRIAAVLGGAGVLALGGVITVETGFHEAASGIDWNVIFLLFGMMVIVSVTKQTGVFEYVAIVAAKLAKGRPFAVMVTLVGVTAVASAMLDNVTTVLLIAPVTLLVCDRLRQRPEQYLIAEALASNIGGAATLIGDPPNIIIGSKARLDFNAFLIHMAPIVVVLMVVFIGLAWLLWGRTMQADPVAAANVMKLDEREAIRDPKLLVMCLVVLSLVLVGFVTHSITHLDPAIVALAGAGVLVAVSRLGPKDYLEDVEWSTLVFFMGLFLLVGALVHVGVIELLGRWLAETVGDRLMLAGTVLLFSSGVLSAIVDNIPYVATLAPIVQEMAPSGSHLEPLWWALALGADLGGNATAIGASANVVIIGIAARNGHPISFWTFTRYGAIVALVTLVISWAYWALRYVVLA
jgi:Na+/H+ antiporter NhaD/arsenite permease-like protein